ncbi:MAG TPA: PAS domain-containing protein [Azospirillaceae bacterium]|nr:PAS domain-containing protein [Azospirillaceae bacterium]
MTLLGRLFLFVATALASAVAFETCSNASARRTGEGLAERHVDPLAFAAQTSWMQADPSEPVLPLPPSGDARFPAPGLGPPRAFEGAGPETSSGAPLTAIGCMMVLSLVWSGGRRFVLRPLRGVSRVVRRWVYGDVPVPGWSATGGEHLGVALEAAGAVAWEWDLATDKIRLSDNAYALLGIDRVHFEQTARSFRALIHPEDGPAVDDALCAARAGAGGFNVEFRIAVAGGRWRCVAEHGRFLADASGRAVRAHGVVIALADRYAARVCPDRVSERLVIAVDATGLGIWEQDFIHGFIDWSDRAKDLMGMPRHATPSVELFQTLVHPDDRDRCMEALERSWDPAGDGVIDIRFRVSAADGSIRYLAAHGRTFFGEVGGERRKLRAIGTLCDVTERETLMQQKDRLLKEVNHRTKNSLQLVSSLLRLESRDVDDADARRRFAEAAARVHSIAAVHDRLYRTEDVETVRLGPLLESLCADLERAGGGRDRVQLVLEADADVDTDHAVPLAIVTNELVTNARKYGKSDGRANVRVFLRPAGDTELVLSVEDDGPGLPEGFDLGRSAGLGLQLVVALSRQIGGQAEALPRMPGAEFRVTFRAKRVDAPLLKEAAARV